MGGHLAATTGSPDPTVRGVLFKLQFRHATSYGLLSQKGRCTGAGMCALMIIVRIFRASRCASRWTASNTLLYSLWKGSLRLSSTTERAIWLALRLSSRSMLASARPRKLSYRSCRKVFRDSMTSFVSFLFITRPPATSLP